MGTFPTANEAARFAVYQCKSAILRGLFWAAKSVGLIRASAASTVRYLDIEIPETRFVIICTPFASKSSKFLSLISCCGIVVNAIASAPDKTRILQNE